jgi:two-component system, OmpR family, sensor histidine kinase KdpD
MGEPAPRKPRRRSTWARARAWAHGLVVHGLPARRAALVGAVAVGLFALAVQLLEDALGRPAQALLLVVPVAATAALGGRRPALAVAALATLTFSLVLPPKGTLTVQVADDLVALVVFSLVAFAVGGLVASRVDALARIEQQRATLLRLVSHDLRTPLAAVVGAASEARDAGWLDDAARRDLLDVVVEEGMRLDRLVANVLSLARSEAGALQPRWQAVDVHEVVEQSTRRLEGVAARTGVTLATAVDPELPIVKGDYVLLEQVVANLVENAVRHTPPGGLVTVRGEPATPQQVLVRVADSGPGVPPGEAATIFEPFRRGGGPAGLAGVGLAICKEVVEAHGGSIAVRDRVAGGAEFTVILPVR